MIALVGLTAISLSMLQASVAAPTSAFRDCLRDAGKKATTEKVAGDGIEDYLRTACTVQMGSLKEALVAFRLKNGMARKAAADDAQMTIDDYIATPADNYRFIVQRDASLQKEADAKAAAARAAQPAAQPAAQAATPQQPKP